MQAFGQQTNEKSKENTKINKINPKKPNELAKTNIKFQYFNGFFG